MKIISLSMCLSCYLILNATQNQLSQDASCQLLKVYRMLEFLALWWTYKISSCDCTIDPENCTSFFTVWQAHCSAQTLLWTPSDLHCGVSFLAASRIFMVVPGFLFRHWSLLRNKTTIFVCVAFVIATVRVLRRRGWCPEMVHYKGEDIQELDAWMMDAWMMDR